MSNHLAVATVTAVLVEVVRSAIQEDVSGATVTHGRPEEPTGADSNSAVNIYLFQVTHNAAWRNADLPTRRPDGTLVQRPQAALNLNYLLSFYGEETQLVPERLLGSAIRTLHAEPILIRERIQQTIDERMSADPQDFLVLSDLAQQIELVKFSPLPLNLEELSKMWSVLLQTPYALSIAYQASVVLIEAEKTPQVALPVRERTVHVLPFAQLVIERVTAAGDANEPITVGSHIVIAGHGLRGQVTRVRIAGIEAIPQLVADRQISLPLPAGLRAGVQSVQVVHELLLGDPQAPHRGFASNVVPFVLHPTIVHVQVTNGVGTGDELRAADVTVTVNPEIGQGQQVVLLLNQDTDQAPQAYSFAAGPSDADSASVTVPISGVKAADYFVRIQVDGAESTLEADEDPSSPTFNRYIGPKVTIP